MSSSKILFQKTGGDFIDPQDAASFIRYKTFVKLVEYSKKEKDRKSYLTIEFKMFLGDCNRTITWDFEDYDISDDGKENFKLEKMDKAIEILLDAKKDLKQAATIYLKEKNKL